MQPLKETSSTLLRRQQVSLKLQQISVRLRDVTSQKIVIFNFGCLSVVISTFYFLYNTNIMYLFNHYKSFFLVSSRRTIIDGTGKTRSYIFTCNKYFDLLLHSWCIGCYNFWSGDYLLDQLLQLSFSLLLCTSKI